MSCERCRDDDRFCPYCSRAEWPDVVKRPRYSWLRLIIHALIGAVVGYSVGYTFVEVLVK